MKPIGRLNVKDGPVMSIGAPKDIHLFSIRIGIRAFECGNGHFFSSSTLEVRHWSMYIHISTLLTDLE